MVLVSVILAVLSSFLIYQSVAALNGFFVFILPEVNLILSSCGTPVRSVGWACGAAGLGYAIFYFIRNFRKEDSTPDKTLIFATILMAVFCICSVL